MIMACLGFLAISCSPVAQSIQHTAALATSSEPTSVLLTYRTPRPSRTPRIPSTPPPTATPNLDLDYYYGGQTITMDDVGRILKLRKGENFSVYLGSEYDWQVESQPDYLISQNVKITPAPGEQGIFVARQWGEGKLIAIGEPACRKAQPPCERPNIMFQISVVVE